MPKNYTPKKNLFFNQTVHGADVGKLHVPRPNNILKTGIGGSVARASQMERDLAKNIFNTPPPKPQLLSSIADPLNIISGAGKTPTPPKGSYYQMGPSLGNRFKQKIIQEWKPYTKKVRFGKAVGRVATKALTGLGKGIVGAGKVGARVYRRTPRSIKAGGLLAGGMAMIGISMLKGAYDQSNEIAYERYMEDAARSKDILNTTRMGLSSGTSRMQNYGSTMGLSNALSRTRHGR